MATIEAQIQRLKGLSPIKLDIEVFLAWYGVTEEAGAGMVSVEDTKPFVEADLGEEYSEGVGSDVVEGSSPLPLARPSPSEGISTIGAITEGEDDGSGESDSENSEGAEGDGDVEDPSETLKIKVNRVWTMKLSNMGVFLAGEKPLNVDLDYVYLQLDIVDAGDGLASKNTEKHEQAVDFEKALKHDSK
ncbi:hypothetical protein U1Q18_044482, partial [Sarracenia purpurea var. burkii]